MNFSTWTRGKKILAALIAVFFLAGIVVTVYLVQRQQEIRSHAQKATVLELSPPNQSAAPGGDAKVSVSLNPGTNQVNFVKVIIRFDPDKFDAGLVVFNPDNNSPLQPLNNIPGHIKQLSNGEIEVDLGVGADPTKVVQQTTPLGSFSLPVKAGATAGETDVDIDQSASQVRSVGSGDAFNENVLQSVVNVKVTITGGECIPNQSTCSWDASDGATSYHYVIIDATPPLPTTARAPIEVGDTSETSVTFNSEPGGTYSCEVTASNECGPSDSAKETSTCPVPSVTPIPTTPVTTETPTPSPSPTPSPTPVPTVTPIPTTKVAPTTPIVEVVTATPVPTNLIAQGPTNTPAPTLPATGNPVVMGGIIGGVLFVLGGLALLLL